MMFSELVDMTPAKSTHIFHFIHVFHKKVHDCMMSRVDILPDFSTYLPWCDILHSVNQLRSGIFQMSHQLK